MARALERAHPGLSCEMVTLDTIGDRQGDVPLETIAGRGVFANEIDAAVVSGRADLAVHSAKDLPSSEPDDAPCIAAVLPRGEVRDALVGRRLDDLAPGAPVATGAPRRRAQIAALRPDLGFVPLRGNIGTRLERVPDLGAIVVALAALERLGRADRVAEVLPTSDCLPQVGQGVIALRCAVEDTATRTLLAPVDDPDTHRCLDTERAFLRRLGGGCEAPVGAYARVVGTDLLLEAVIASGDGHVVLRRSRSGRDPDALGRDLAEEMLVGDGAATLVGP